MESAQSDASFKNGVVPDLESTGTRHLGALIVREIDVSRQMIRGLARVVARHWPVPVLASLKSGRKMYVDLRSGIGRGLYVKGEFDPAVFPPIKQALRPGGVFLDIGANVGYYSMLALDGVGGSGMVHAFEIDPRPLRCLQRTIHRFKIDNLYIHRIAVTNWNGTGILSQTSESGASHIDSTGKGISVRTTSLDSWVASLSLPRIDAIKIDVEGCEPIVLQGATETLKRFRPVVVFEAYQEYWNRYGNTELDVGRLLNDLGYTTSHVPDCWSPTLVATPRESVAATYSVS